MKLEKRRGKGRMKGNGGLKERRLKRNDKREKGGRIIFRKDSEGRMKGDGREKGG